MQEKDLEPTELNWAKVKKLQMNHRWMAENDGKWVAIIEGEIVGTGDNPMNVREAVAQKYLEGRILLVRVLEGKIYPESNTIGGVNWLDYSDTE